MAFIDDMLRDLFTDKKNRMSFKENFAVSDEQLKKVELWRDSSEGQEIFEHVYKNYHLKKAGVNCHPEVHILTSPYANGFALSCHPPLNEKIFSYLFFAFGQRMLDLGYRKVSLDRRIREVNDQVHVTEKLYFKPSYNIEPISGKINQLFGNVTIEKIYVDNEPNFLKVLVTVYSDHLYHEALPFDQYIEHLFKAD